MAKVNLETSTTVQAHIGGQQVNGYLALKVKEQDVEDWSFEVDDELEVVVVVTQVVT